MFGVTGIVGITAGAAAGGALGALVTGGDPGMAAATAAITTLAVAGVSHFMSELSSPGADSTVQQEHVKALEISEGKPDCGCVNTEPAPQNFGSKVDAPTYNLNNHPLMKFGHKLKQWGEKALNAAGLSNPRYETIYNNAGNNCYDVFVIDFLDKPTAFPTEEQFNEMLNYKGPYPNGIISEINSRIAFTTPGNVILMKGADTFWFQSEPRNYLWMDPIAKNGPWSAEAMNYIQIGHGLHRFGCPNFLIDNVVDHWNMDAHGHPASWQEIYKAKEGARMYYDRDDW